MKKYMLIALAVLFAGGAVEVPAQSFLKKVGKAIEKEVEKGVEHGINRLKGSRSQTAPAQEQSQAQSQPQPQSRW